MAKWNEVIRIERNLSGRARFLGGNIYGQILKRHQNPARELAAP